jgi:histidinol dehydrogenase
MLRRLDLRSDPDRFATTATLLDALPRPSHGGPGSPEALAAVRAILADVLERGDAAVREATQRFDGVDVPVSRVPTHVIAEALAATPAPLRAALEAAAEAIASFHRTQRHADTTHRRGGLEVRSIEVPVERAGCYVPGGRAAYPSTVLMTAVPAKVAGVEQVVLCMPPDRATGMPAAVTLAAAAVAGVDEVYAIGGAQAVGAMAYGTGTIRPVDVIVGPGNVFVALAQREVAGQGRVGIPSSFAGPSEVVVIADASANAEHAAIDVLLQAEHGPDGIAWLVTWDEAVADAVDAACERLVAVSPRRALLEEKLAKDGYIVVVDTPAQAVAVSNAVAPEHLELMTADPEALVPLVRHAGAVFTGPWAPASVGDYLAGPSHVLPTFGTARYASALTVADFTKHVHVVSLDRAALEEVGPHVIALAEAEGLAAHADSVRLRLAAGGAS